MICDTSIKVIGASESDKFGQSLVHKSRLAPKFGVQTH